MFNFSAISIVLAYYGLTCTSKLKRFYNLVNFCYRNVIKDFDWETKTNLG